MRASAWAAVLLLATGLSAGCEPARGPRAAGAVATLARPATLFDALMAKGRSAAEAGDHRRAIDEFSAATMSARDDGQRAELMRAVCKSLDALKRWAEARDACAAADVVARRAEMRSVGAEAGQSATATAGRTMTIARLGLTIAELTPATRLEHGLSEAVAGVVVTAAEAGRPAALRGIVPGDVIVAVDRVRVEGAVHAYWLLDSPISSVSRILQLLINRKGELRSTALRF